MDRDVALDLVAALSAIKDVLDDIKGIQAGILQVLTPAPTTDIEEQG